MFFSFEKIIAKSHIKKVLYFVDYAGETVCLSLWIKTSRGLCALAKSIQHYTTEEELGMPWMMVLVGVPLMALKMCSESGRPFFMPSSTGLI